MGPVYLLNRSKESQTQKEILHLQTVQTKR